MSDESRTVLVCGGRNYTDWHKVRDTLDKFHAGFPIGLLIHGGGGSYVHEEGADILADEWCKLREIPCLRVPAKWTTGGGGKSEGPKRNALMLTWSPDVVIAFPGGRGTANMVRQARKAHIAVIEITEE